MRELLSVMAGFLSPFGVTSTPLHAKDADMQPDRKAQIKRAFGRASAHYDAHANVHRRVAADLLAQCGDKPAGQLRILEIGCGTGLLTRLIAAQWPDAEIIATDLAEPMLAQAARSGIAAQFLRMDGEWPDMALGRFDLILSSLTFQWFADLPRALARLHDMLAPGGQLHFATMGKESFASWRAAHAACGAPCGLIAQPDLAAVRSMLAAFPGAAFCVRDFPLSARGGIGLLRHLHAIGAHVPPPEHRPLPPTLLKRVIAAYDAGGGTTSYHVIFGSLDHD
jgi:malonyl-CoA O-methyltransferase